MGGKARRIRDNVRRFLNEEAERNKELLRVYETIKRLLVHDLTTDAFADMYAQTLVYGLLLRASMMTRQRTSHAKRRVN